VWNLEGSDRLQGEIDGALRRSAVLASQVFLDLT
jgi:hypothetical protein